MRAGQVVIFDPIAFRGGSKVATENMFGPLLKAGTELVVLTSDEDSFRSEGMRKARLLLPARLAESDRGLPFLGKHLLYCLQILVLRLRIGRFSAILGIAGPGNDLGAHWAARLLGCPMIQFVHGPVAPSRTSGRCLASTEKVFTLASAKESVVACVQRAGKTLSPRALELFENGITAPGWPSRCASAEPRLLWAASLLKWKGLDVLLGALRAISAEERPPTHICYLRPARTSEDVSDIDEDVENVYWHHAPENLDEIRSACSMFVSTSHEEPFGLSVLEALAAGLCVLIPTDGAYWDQVLEDDLDCVKYRPRDQEDLARKIKALAGDPSRVRRIGAAGAARAERYRADRIYQPVLRTIRELLGQNTPPAA